MGSSLTIIAKVFFLMKYLGGLIRKICRSTIKDLISKLSFFVNDTLKQSPSLLIPPIFSISGGDSMRPDWPAGTF